MISILNIYTDLFNSSSISRYVHILKFTSAHIGYLEQAFKIMITSHKSSDFRGHVS